MITLPEGRSIQCLSWRLLIDNTGLSVTPKYLTSLIYCAWWLVNVNVHPSCKRENFLVTIYSLNEMYIMIVVILFRLRSRVRNLLLRSAQKEASTRYHYMNGENINTRINLHHDAHKFFVVVKSDAAEKPCRYVIFSRPRLDLMEFMLDLLALWSPKTP